MDQGAEGDDWGVSIFLGGFCWQTSEYYDTVEIIEIILFRITSRGQVTRMGWVSLKYDKFTKRCKLDFGMCSHTLGNLSVLPLMMQGSRVHRQSLSC